jgi:hypothetical protein
LNHAAAGERYGVPGGLEGQADRPSNAAAGASDDRDLAIWHGLHCPMSPPAAKFGKKYRKSATPFVIKVLLRTYYQRA